ncbi:MAG: helix-turn-helix domain-containing protein [Methylophilaceae bacterium]|nr:helix-turn-helix domain-containing protein [Methylophilaceae bacterium]
MEERIEMSKREIERLKVLEWIKEGAISQRQGAVVLGLTMRQVRRLMRRYEREGVAGVVSRRCGRPSNRRVGQAGRKAVVAFVRSR